MTVVVMSALVPVRSQAPERKNIVWSTGYDTQHDNLNPWTGSPAFGIALMYEPLFGLNGAKNDTLIPVIGTKYYWDATGENLTVEINPSAKWSDGVAITADDVIYSYDLASHQERWTGMGDLFDSMEKIDTLTMKFTMSPTRHFSYRMEQYLYTEIPIVPKHIWQDIEAIIAPPGRNFAVDLFKNDWLSPSFNASWKVASGPYFPYFRDLTAGEEIYKRRDDWWGKNVLHMDIPNYDGFPDAEFLGMRKYADNTAKDAGILTAAVDLHSGFYSSVWTALGQNPNVETWFGRSYQDYYLALGAVITVCFNQIKFPFNEVWFRTALAYSIEYNTIEIAGSGGYWNRARQGFLDDRSAAHKTLYNETIQELYGIDTNNSKAIEILAANCYQVGGIWYTNDVSAEALAAEAAGRLTIPADMDGGHGGRNIRLGDYEILVPAGWTDVTIATQMWAADFTDLNITFVKREVDFWNTWRVKIMDQDFDAVMQCCGPHLINDPYTVLEGMRNNVNRPWNNASSWYSPEYEALYQAFDTAQGDDRKEIASQMQYLLATEIPEIPVHVNGFWYLVNTKYWTNWLGENNYFQDPQCAYSINRYALKQRLFLALKKVGGEGTTPTDEPKIPWADFTAPMTVGIVLLTIVQIRKLRKQHE